MNKRVLIGLVAPFRLALACLAAVAFLALGAGPVAATGLVTNYTGTGISGPEGITAGPDGALWFTNSSNQSIGRITTGGVVSNYTGSGISDPRGIAVGSDGALWFTNSTFPISIGRITTSGVVSHYSSGANQPIGITAGPDGALWFTNAYPSESIGRITTGGVASHYTGTGISFPYDITAGPDGALWFTNPENNSIGRITTGGVVSNYTGTGISAPSGITAGPDGALWFTNPGNASIGRITTGATPVVSNYTGTGIAQPQGIAAGPDGALWFTNIENNSIGRITTGGVVSNYTGTEISEPVGIAAGPDGALWFTNRGNNSIGRISATSPHYYKNSYPGGGVVAKEKLPVISWGTLTVTPESGHGTPTTCEDVAGGYVENPEGPEGGLGGKGQTSTLTAYNCSNTECPEGETEIEGKSYPREPTVNAETLPWPSELMEPEVGKVRPESKGVRLSVQCIAHGSKVSASGPGEHEPKIAMGTPYVCVTDATHLQAPSFEKGTNFGPSVSKLTFDNNSGKLSCEGGAFTAKTSGSLKMMGYKGNELIIAK